MKSSDIIKKITEELPETTNNLTSYKSAKSEVNAPINGSFDNYFIGALSARVSHEDWNSALETAKFSFKRETIRQ
jgi:hypothetical protein